MSKNIQQYLSQPKVSVIIPIYNTAAYLHDTINSIRNQSLKRR